MVKQHSHLGLEQIVDVINKRIKVLDQYNASDLVAPRIHELTDLLETLERIEDRLGKIPPPSPGEENEQ